MGTIVCEIILFDCFLMLFIFFVDMYPDSRKGHRHVERLYHFSRIVFSAIVRAACWIFTVGVD